MKICNACKEEKSLLNFYFRKDTNKHANTCKTCCIDGKRMTRSLTHKKCKHCGVEKLFSEYQKAGKYLQPYCKPCDSTRKEKHRNENEQHYKEKHKINYLKTRKLATPEQLIIARQKINEGLKRARDNATANKMSVEERKRRKSLQDKRYRENNKEKVLARKRDYYYNNGGLEKAKAWQQKNMSNLEFRIKKNLRSRIHVALKRNIKSQSTMQLLGCSVDYFKFYFQFFFINAMTWEKYLDGRIVIDHIKPCVLFDLTKEDEQKKCFHYSNLQPLWEIDNLKKGATYNQNTNVA